MQSVAKESRTNRANAVNHSQAGVETQVVIPVVRPVQASVHPLAELAAAIWLTGAELKLKLKLKLQWQLKLKFKLQLQLKLKLKLQWQLKLKLKLKWKKEPLLRIAMRAPEP